MAYQMTICNTISCQLMSNFYSIGTKKNRVKDLCQPTEFFGKNKIIDAVEFRITYFKINSTIDYREYARKLVDTSKKFSG